VDINQVYKAPSIPKLNKKNISSSVLKGAAAAVNAPKLKKSTFSFIKPGIVPDKKVEGLKAETSPIKIAETLVETNRILVEIQKQLSLDFAMRIAEEKETIKKIKESESKRKFTSKESFVEGIKKIGGKLGNIVGKVTAPFKSVFEKIKEFFSLILTGIVANVAFTWLKDEKNRETLYSIFSWISKAFVPILVGVLSVKLFKWVRRLWRLSRFLLKLPGRLGTFARYGRFTLPPPISPDSARGNLFRTSEGTRRGISTQTSTLRGPDRYSPNYQSGTGPIQQYSRTKGVIGKTLQTLDVGAKQLSKNFLGIFGVGPGKKTLTNSILKFLRPLLKRIPLVGALIDFGISVALGENPGRAAFGAIGAALLGAMGTFIGGPVGTFLGALAGDIAGRALYDLFFGGKTVDPGLSQRVNPPQASPATARRSSGRTNTPGGRKMGGTIYASSGMTVPGSGSGLIDSVQAFLAPGEEVIRASMAMLYRPLLKDINNGGRMWTMFSSAVRKLLSVSQGKSDVSQEFSKVIEDFNNYLKQEIQNKRTGKKRGGGGIRPSTRSKPSLQPSTPSNVNLFVSQSSSGVGGMTVLPMMLPKQSSAPPQIPNIQSTVATDVPIISPVNFKNPYMSITPEYYNIQMFVGV